MDFSIVFIFISVAALIAKMVFVSKLEFGRGRGGVPFASYKFLLLTFGLVLPIYYRSGILRNKILTRKANIAVAIFWLGFLFAFLSKLIQGNS